MEVRLYYKKTDILDGSEKNEVRESNLETFHLNFNKNGGKNNTENHWAQYIQDPKPVQH